MRIERADGQRPAELRSTRGLRYCAAAMKIENWLRFRWELAKLPPIDAQLPKHYYIARAVAEDEAEVRKVISRSFVLDPSWNGAIRDVMQTVDGWLEGAFANQNSVVLALRHGTRVIGAAAAAVTAPDATHLAPGPCILVEYRNRGFGKHLLAQTLAALRDVGLREATGIAKRNSAAAKFLYTRFGGVAEPYELTPLLAA